MASGRCGASVLYRVPPGIAVWLGERRLYKTLKRTHARNGLRPQPAAWFFEAFRSGLIKGAGV